MNLLLDSHTLLWLMEASPSLSPQAAALIADSANSLNLSMASLWEIAIKTGLGKLLLSVPFDEFVTTAVEGYELNLLPITTADCIRYRSLGSPHPNHRDPFDRMIVVQAQFHGLNILGVDSAFDAYGVSRLW